MFVDAAGARVLAERISNARPQAPAPAAPEAQPLRVFGRRRQQARARIGEWVEPNRVAPPPREHEPRSDVWIGPAPRPASGERWFFHERAREVEVDGARVSVVETICTKALPSGLETTVVRRRTSS